MMQRGDCPAHRRFQPGRTPENRGNIVINRFRQAPIPLAVAALFSLPSASLMANPAGGTVVSGNVTIHQHPGNTIVNQSSDRGIVNWQSFSIGAGEVTRFNLPGAGSAILNRVTTNSPSSIYGTLSSNGQVFLINPSGIVIGPGGQINVGGLVASTRDISNEQFLQGRDLSLSGASGGTIVNLGRITAAAGDVLLAGAKVGNAGEIAAAQGVTALVAGNDILYAPDNHSRVLVRSGVDIEANASGVENTGVIRAAQVELHSAGGNPYNLAINHAGLIQATRVGQVGGRVILSAGSGETRVSGTIDATGHQGNRIHVLGDKVTLAATALLDVSADQGGGTILVGGDKQGKNASIRNASHVVVEAGAQLKADATADGHGGKVIVWADDSTSFHGTISARGGSNDGDGGFAEVSGKQSLVYRGTTDLRAANGKTGTLLLDPTDFTIGYNLGLNPANYIDTADLRTQLQTANVTISTASGGTDAGDITIDASASQDGWYAVSHSLTLQADRDIIVNGGLLILPPAPGDSPTLTLEAGRDITVAANLNGTTEIGAGFFPAYALVGGSGLTLAAGLTDAEGKLTIGANSDIGTLTELSGGSAPGGATRVFGTSAANTTLTGWSKAGTASVFAGKTYGASGTNASGIYYQDSTPVATQIDPVITQITSQQTFDPVIITITQKTPVQEIGDALLGFVESIANGRDPEVRHVYGMTFNNYTLPSGSIFGPEIDANLTFTRMIAEATAAPGQSATEAYANMLTAVYEGIRQTPPSQRSAIDQKMFIAMDAVVKLSVAFSPESVKINQLKASIERDNAALSALKDESERLGKSLGLASSFDYVRTPELGEKIAKLEADIADNSQRLNSLTASQSSSANTTQIFRRLIENPAQTYNNLLVTLLWKK